MLMTFIRCSIKAELHDFMFQTSTKYQEWMRWKWSDVLSAKITVNPTANTTASSGECIAQMILNFSVKQENGKKVLTDAENMSQVWEAGRVQLMVQGVLLPELWRTV